MNCTAKAPFLIETHQTITTVKDGDSVIVQAINSTKEKEIRLYGIDAPEVIKCRKLQQDEAETHLAGALLLKLGKLSLQYILTLAPPGIKCTLIQEQDNQTDLYGRTLAYVILPDGRCLNELMVSEGYAKPYSKYFCSELPKYQTLNTFAKAAGKGLYSIVNKF